MDTKTGRTVWEFEIPVIASTINRQELGGPDPSVGAGSTDMGDVSQAIPSIHPYLAICDQGHALCHQHAFAACARSERGYATALTAAKAMARTALDVIEDAALLERVRAEFATP